ncbi:MAG: hypothetical protein BMS9Abin31_1129 [Gammaproteobacteria bacterium]|nr:MAG: hypothetical protein BMS9Abin31_1129 [Gammaproteobacteria bacterium]
MSQRDHAHMRQRLAQKTAQILLDSGSRDFHAAKQKAAQQLGATDTKSLPNNSEIESALSEYQRIFRATSQPEHLSRLREIAIEAMQFLSSFNPRLVGSVLSGTADEHSVICIHLFADTVESVGFYLQDNKIPNNLAERRLKIALDQYQNYSTYEFDVDKNRLELVVFLPKQKQIPLSPVDGKPMQRAGITDVELLLNSSE